MDTGKLEKFAQNARRQLREQVAARLEQVLSEDSIEQREKADAIQELRDEIKDSSKHQVIDKVAYTWFNRFIALRFMDVNYYTRVRTVSPVEGYTQPEILQEAKQGVIDFSLRVDEDRVMGLLNGEITSPNPQQEAYRLLLEGACNARHDEMPFLFQEIDDYTELLLPEDLLSENAVLQDVRETLTMEMCQDVEVIGWVYQFYISEKKDEVIGSKGKIQPEDIPAATQLFTPHWIVRYLVENSLGRLWLLNNPESCLREVMEYYIEPVEEEEEYLEVDSPEELKICDPACGSGHMLTYAFDLLYHLYEEEGYDPVQIPGLILENNLYGIEIDERAGDLAAFALMMKAREKDQRFFNRGIKPNICVLENVVFTDVELEQYMDAVGRDLFTGELEHTLKQFEQAENVGSLIQPSLSNPKYVKDELTKRGIPQELFLHNTHNDVFKVLVYVSYLKQKYHVVVANPPYMGSRNMNNDLKEYGKKQYPASYKDLFAMFIKKGFYLVSKYGYNAMVTMQSWMFLSSYEKIREQLVRNKTILCMVHMDNMVMRIAFGTSATIWKNQDILEYEGNYSYVSSDDLDESGTPIKFPVENDRLSTASSSDFNKIPGSPIAYWAKEEIISCFTRFGRFGDYVETREGLTTGSNNTFLRYWHEVSYSNICFDAKSEKDAKNKGKRWFAYVKGGSFRRWSGNFEFVVDWENDGKRIKNFKDPRTGRIRSHNYNGDYAFREGFTWSGLSSGKFSVRHVPTGFMFDAKSPMGFTNKREYLPSYEAFLNSQITSTIMPMLAPTMDYKIGHVLNLPFNRNIISDIRDIGIKNRKISMTDWDFYETSWNFSESPLLSLDQRDADLKSTYLEVRSTWHDMTSEMKRMEENNNRILIQAYELADEISEKVPLDEITLTCNPCYRYGGDKTEDELEALLLEDTMKEFISYSVGCMFGRYSLDEPGLILVNQGDTMDTYLAQIPAPTFMPDDDNVIPILEEGWFTDDITERFKHFLRVTFGEEHYQENLDFLEKAIGRDIRDFLLKDFYEYHCKMYSKPYYGKRPIYWMFESPKGHFKALIYMHRYTPDTVSNVLNDYLHEFRAKLQAQEAHLEEVKKTASKSEQISADKEIEHIKEILADLREYEDDILYPLATERIHIDLDDGVDHNYPLFGKALTER